jgi:glycosidase
MMLNLLDSHDTHRFYTEVGKDKKKLLCALALEIVYPGATCLYYGTEICMEGGYDPDSRRCFNWNHEEWDMDFFHEVQELLKLKKKDILRYGIVRVYANEDVLCIERRLDRTRFILKINLSEQECDGVEPEGYKVIEEVMS